ncbi:MAG TPA: alpha/beta hydrolase-fold protein [Nocardioides sp.]|uniref:alpha/beta hydrolase n=1 Tax=Nocardioides sp. TaxID=35761 RepID=UPI002E34BEC2|nr:alpha/beta hydrolase-fold protein [Nocardioides sp.]HEX5090751.1 alpha/beta hydrolase-fold protein [Nocardioides sp.]
MGSARAAGARSSSGALPPTALEGEELVFRLSDPEHDHAEVKVWCDLQLGIELDMARVEGGWELRLPLPDLDCLEYLFEVDREMSPDPGNPELVEGAFGPHSWLAMPGYQPPAWLHEPSRPGDRHQLSVGDVDVEVWEPAEHAGEPLPLLLVHDGPEMDKYGGVVRYAATRPPLRVALLNPGPWRDKRYAASSAYAATLVGEVLPAVTDAFATSARPVLLGQSLGALAALHAAWTTPGTFAGLMLQSGSFFTPRLDPQESGYSHFAQVAGFVATILDAQKAADRLEVTMTCGTAEENLANNLLMRDQLREVGLNVAWGEVRQGHTWTCWRDSLHPHLGELLTRAWG